MGGMRNKNANLIKYQVQRQAFFVLPISIAVIKTFVYDLFFKRLPEKSTMLDYRLTSFQNSFPATAIASPPLSKKRREPAEATKYTESE